MGGNISFSGLSGFDTQAIVDQLIQIKRQPIVQIQQQQREIDTKRSIFSTLSSRLSSLQSVADDLNNSRTLGAKSASSSNKSTVTASATSFASVGEINLSNITLATKSSEAFTAASDQSEQFAAGTFFDFDVNGESFSIDLTALSGEDQSLEGLRDAINSQAGDAVSAVVLNTGDADDPYKLVIQSDATGEDNQISNISTDIQVNTSSGVQNFDTIVSDQVLAENATLELNGVSISRSSNTIDDLVEGVTFSLQKASTEEVTITIGNNNDAVKGRLEEFVEAYNSANAIIQEQNQLDPETGFAGPLSGDFTLRKIQNSLQQAVIGGVEDADGNRYSLASLGIEVDKSNGNLTFDSSAFDEAIAENPELTFDLLINRGTTTSTDFEFVSGTSDTTEGEFGINITGYDGDGNVEGTFTFNGVTYTGAGNAQILEGPDGSPAEGLKIRIDSGVTGDLGSLFYSAGIAAKLETTLSNFTNPIGGILTNLDDRLETDYRNLSDEIEAFEERLENERRILTNQFIAAEEAISQLQSQQSAFTSQLATLQ